MAVCRPELVVLALTLACTPAGWAGDRALSYSAAPVCARGECRPTPAARVQGALLQAAALSVVSSSGGARAFGSRAKDLPRRSKARLPAWYRRAQAAGLQGQNPVTTTRPATRLPRQARVREPSGSFGSGDSLREAYRRPVPAASAASLEPGMSHSRPRLRPEARGARHRRLVQESWELAQEELARERRFVDPSPTVPVFSSAVLATAADERSLTPAPRPTAVSSGDEPMETDSGACCLRPCMGPPASCPTARTPVSTTVPAVSSRVVRVVPQSIPPLLAHSPMASRSGGFSSDVFPGSTASLLLPDGQMTASAEPSSAIPESMVSPSSVAATKASAGGFVSSSVAGSTPSPLPFEGAVNPDSVSSFVVPEPTPSLSYSDGLTLTNAVSSSVLPEPTSSLPDQVFPTPLDSSTLDTIKSHGTYRIQLEDGMGDLTLFPKGADKINLTLVDSDIRTDRSFILSRGRVANIDLTLKNSRIEAGEDLVLFKGVFKKQTGGESVPAMNLTIEDSNLTAGHDLSLLQAVRNAAQRTAEHEALNVTVANSHLRAQRGSLVLFDMDDGRAQSAAPVRLRIVRNSNLTAENDVCLFNVSAISGSTKKYLGLEHLDLAIEDSRLDAGDSLGLVHRNNVTRDSFSATQGDARLKILASDLTGGRLALFAGGVRLNGKATLRVDINQSRLIASRDDLFLFGGNVTTAPPRAEGGDLLRDVFGASAGLLPSDPVDGDGNRTLPDGNMTTAGPPFSGLATPFDLSNFTTLPPSVAPVQPGSAFPEVTIHGSTLTAAQGLKLFAGQLEVPFDVQHPLPLSVKNSQLRVADGDVSLLGGAAPDRLNLNLTLDNTHLHASHGNASLVQELGAGNKVRLSMNASSLQASMNGTGAEAGQQLVAAPVGRVTGRDNSLRVENSRDNRVEARIEGESLSDPLVVASLGWGGVDDSLGHNTLEQVNIGNNLVRAQVEGPPPDWSGVGVGTRGRAHASLAGRLVGGHDHEGQPAELMQGLLDDIGSSGPKTGTSANSTTKVSGGLTTGIPGGLTTGIPAGPIIMQPHGLNQFSLEGNRVFAGVMGQAGGTALASLGWIQEGGNGTQAGAVPIHQSHCRNNSVEAALCPPSSGVAEAGLTWVLDDRNCAGSRTQVAAPCRASDTACASPCSGAGVAVNQTAMTHNRLAVNIFSRTRALDPLCHLFGDERHVLVLQGGEGDQPLTASGVGEVHCSCSDCKDTGVSRTDCQWPPCLDYAPCIAPFVSAPVTCQKSLPELVYCLEPLGELSTCRTEGPLAAVAFQPDNSSDCDADRVCFQPGEELYSLVPAGDWWLVVTRRTRPGGSSDKSTELFRLLSLSRPATSGSKPRLYEGDPYKWCTRLSPEADPAPGTHFRVYSATRPGECPQEPHNWPLFIPDRTGGQVYVGPALPEALNKTHPLSLLHSNGTVFHAWQSGTAADQQRLGWTVFPAGSLENGQGLGQVNSCQLLPGSELMLLSEEDDGAVNVWIRERGVVGRWSLDEIREKGGEAKSEHCFVLAGEGEPPPLALARYGECLYSLHQGDGAPWIERWSMTGERDPDWRGALTGAVGPEPRLIGSHYRLYLVSGDSLPHGDGSRASAARIGQDQCLSWQGSEGPVPFVLVPRSPCVNRASEDFTWVIAGSAAAVVPVLCTVLGTACCVYKCWRRKRYDGVYYPDEPDDHGIELQERHPGRPVVWQFPSQAHASLEHPASRGLPGRRLSEFLSGAEYVEPDGEEQDVAGIALRSQGRRVTFSHPDVTRRWAVLVDNNEGEGDKAGAAASLEPQGGRDRLFSPATMKKLSVIMEGDEDTDAFCSLIWQESGKRPDAVMAESPEDGPRSPARLVSAGD